MSFVKTNCLIISVCINFSRCKSNSAFYIHLFPLKRFLSQRESSYQCNNLTTYWWLFAIGLSNNDFCWYFLVLIWSLFRPFIIRKRSKKYVPTNFSPVPKKLSNWCTIPGTNPCACLVTARSRHEKKLVQLLFFHVHKYARNRESNKRETRGYVFSMIFQEKLHIESLACEMTNSVMHET